MLIKEVESSHIQLLDVRTMEEWQEGHAEHALHIPVNKLLDGKVGSLSPNKKIYVYCASGGRAGVAASYLQKKGFSAENIGGLADWTRAGGKLSKI